MFCFYRRTHLYGDVVTAVFFVIAAAVGASAAPLDVTVCFSIDSPFYQAMYIPQYYSYPHIRPRVRVIGAFETPEPTPRGVALALVHDGADCDVYIGPGSSPLAVAVNAVMNSVWMAYAVTATEFSDRITYPLFNRVIPSVATNQHAMLTLMTAFKWDTVTILCTDNSYGQASAAALSNVLNVDPHCIPQYGDYSDAAAVVRIAMASKTRVFYIASNPNEAAHTYGVQALLDLDTNHQLIVIFAEVICSHGDQSWSTVLGALCATFSTDAIYEPYYQAFLARDKTAERAAVGTIAGFNYSTATANAYGGYSALAADAARFVYSALDKYVAQQGALPPSVSAATAWIRAQSLPDGFTGPIQMPRGDVLLPTPMRIFNSVPGNGSVPVADVSSLLNLTLLTPTMFVLGRDRSIADMPPAVDVPPPATAEPPYWAVALGACCIIMLSAAAAYVWHERRINAFRPLDPSAPFAIMFVGIKNADEVREAGDANAAAAFAHVMQTLRTAVRATGCYEVRRIDETTVKVVAKSVDNLLCCAAQLMTTTQDGTDWSKIMNAPLAKSFQGRGSRAGQSRSGCAPTPVASTPDSHAAATGGAARVSRRSLTMEVSQGSASDSECSTPRSLSALQHVPQVHIGINFGFATIDYNEAANTVSYVGETVSTAAMITDAAVAGQVLVSRAAHEAAGGDSNEKQGWQAVGSFERLPAFAAVAPDTLIFVPSGMSMAAVERMRVAAKRAIDDLTESGGANTHGAIAAALQRVEAGLSQRRIGIAMVKIPSLRDEAPSAKTAAAVRALLADIATIASEQRGEVQCVAGCTVLITVNAGAPAAQPAVRAALIALEVTRIVQEQGLVATAGTAFGAAVVGHYNNGAGAAAGGPSSFATLGPLLRQAKLAQRMAERSGLSVCALDTNSYDDLCARLHVATVGVANAALDASSTPVRVLSVISERDQTSGEWLYAMGEATGGVGANERAWQRYVQHGDAPDIETLRLVEAETGTSADPHWSAALAAALSNLKSLSLTPEKNRTL